MPDQGNIINGNRFFFTLVTRERRPLLCLEPARKILRGALEEIRKSHPFVIEAFVLLPDHMHCIWTLPAGDDALALRVGWITRQFAARSREVPALNQQIGTGTAPPGTISRIREREEAIWRRGFRERPLAGEEDFHIHCDSIHFNPVKHGLVESPKEWPYSSFHRFVERGLYPESCGEPPSAGAPPAEAEAAGSGGG
jgi:putative transposase